jgi:hypothetical protein
MNALVQTPVVQRAAPPRHYLSAAPDSVLPESGLPQDRHARIAARRSFVGLKQRFMQAVALLDGMRGDWLRHQVRQAHEPIDLWMLRGAVFAALETAGAHSRRTRDDLDRVLDSVFPDSGMLQTWGLRG